MKITGRKDDANELIQMIQWKGKYANSGLGRAYECWIDDTEEYNEDFVSVEVSGYCAWSVLAAMRDWNGRHPSLESETERLGLLVEFYSSESGCGFQEHCIIDKGNVVISECIDYEEHWIEEFDSVKEYNEEYGTDFTEDMVQDGYVYIGGYGDEYGNFMKVEIDN